MLKNNKKYKPFIFNRCRKMDNPDEPPDDPLEYRVGDTCFFGKLIRMGCVDLGIRKIGRRKLRVFRFGEFLYDFLPYQNNGQGQYMETRHKDEL